MALTGTVALSISLNQTKTVGLATASAPISISKTMQIGDGTGANQAKAAWSDSRTITATSENLDFSGILTDAFGTSIVGTAVKLLYIENTHLTADLLVGGAASNGFVSPFGGTADKIRVGPGQFVLLINLTAAGYGVTAGTADLLKIDAGAATITYKIVVIMNA